MGKASPSPNFVRDYKLRFDMHRARIDVAQAIAYWRHIAKDLPPDHCLAAMEVLLASSPPDGTLQFTSDNWTRDLEQIRTWRVEREALEDETLSWLNAPLNAEGPTR